MAAILARGYTDPAQYATDLLYAAYGYFPFGAYAFEGTAEDDAQQIAGRPNGIPELQAFVADDPQANIPDWMRRVLRDMSAKGGE